jgi:serine/threonine protein kinase/Tol biopolymer transport system component
MATLLLICIDNSQKVLTRVNQVKSEQWQKLDELFHQALEREPGARTLFIAETCAGDLELRRELESMLAHHDEANSFIESPAYVVAAETIFDDDYSEALVGKSFGPYQILRVLGKGGMGAVYLALDQELHRNVALKFLHDDLLSDRQRVQRFKQEARAVSALNHPNILTIHQIGDLDGRHFIATEFVEGETLREIIRHKHLTVSENLDIATQIASALAAAHAANIMHRDIKPENVMVRPDGYIKVLDFGLAKLTEASVTNSKQSTLINTEQGTIIGTVQYMSPEQTRGLDLDARTDLWSFGVVLYEMLTEHPPFDGNTKSDVIAAILEREPLPLTRYDDDTPEELQQIVSKTLKKNRDERYQTAKELLVDLRGLKQQLDANSDSYRETLAQSPGLALPATLKKAPPRKTRTSAAVRPTSSAEYIVSEIKQHKGAMALVLVAISIAAIGLSVWLFKFRPTNAPAARPPTTAVTKITASGKVKGVAISPDGKYIAYVLEESGRGSFWLRQVGTTSDIQIAAPGDYGQLTFSADGTYIFYQNFLGALYQIPILGGPRKLVLEHVNSPITFSPDGKRFAFVRFPGPGESALMIANSDGTSDRTLATRKQTERFEGQGPSWSPDGRLIACAIAGSNARGDYTNLIAVQVESGAEESIISEKSFGIGKVAWLSDMTGLLVVGNDSSSYYSQIWQVFYPGGEVRKISNDFNSYDDISVTANSSILVAVQENSNLNISVAPNGDTARLKQITSESGDYNDLSWAFNDTLIYDSNAGGNLDLWSIGTNGGSPRQLTLNTGVNYGPSVAPDGRYILFTSNRSGTTNVWRMDGDGGNAKQLTDGSGNDSPVCSPDEKWVIYLHNIAYRDDPSLRKTPSLWRIPIDGGEPVQLTDKQVSRPVISPDGKLIACSHNSDPTTLSKGQWKIAVIPFEGGEPVKLYDIPAHPFWDAPGVRWSPDGKALTYRLEKDGIDNLWNQPLDGAQPTQLTHFESGQINSFAWSRDGRLALSRGVETRDVVLVRNFR